MPADIPDATPAVLLEDAPPPARRIPRSAFVSVRARDAGKAAGAPRLAWSRERDAAGLARLRPVLDLSPIERALARRAPRLSLRHALLLALAGSVMWSGMMQARYRPVHRARIVPVAIERGHMVT